MANTETNMTIQQQEFPHKGTGVDFRSVLRVPALVILLGASLLLWSPLAIAQSDTPEAEEGEETTEEGGDKKPVGKHVFVNLEPLVSPVLDDRSIKGKITIVLKLYMLKKGIDEKVRQRIPKLNDAYLNYMYRYGSSAASTGVMQLDSVLATLQRLTDKILGKGVATVLLDEVTRTRSN